MSRKKGEASREQLSDSTQMLWWRKAVTDFFHDRRREPLEDCTQITWGKAGVTSEQHKDSTQLPRREALVITKQLTDQTQMSKRKDADGNSAPRYFPASSSGKNLNVPQLNTAVSSAAVSLKKHLQGPTIIPPRPMSQKCCTSDVYSREQLKDPTQMTWEKTTVTSKHHKDPTHLPMRKTSVSIKELKDQTQMSKRKVADGNSTPKSFPASSSGKSLNVSHLHTVMPSVAVSLKKNLEGPLIISPQPMSYKNECSTSHGFIINSAVTKQLTEQKYLKHFTSSTAKDMSHKEKLQLEEPPDNFRSIPILPCTNDFLSSAFIRPNIINGRYQDADHYLDVQFRLLREDYVKSLRDGIVEYKELKKAGISVAKCNNVHVYENVNFVSQQIVPVGIVYIAVFRSRQLSHVKWESSKRFLSGSLLCISDDDFKTMMFATVTEREVHDLKKGTLMVKFEEITNKTLYLINPLRKFVVIESTAFFEAYRHNLKVLSELNEEKLPMKRYIVNVERKVMPPRYLNNKVTYDMRPLLLPMNQKSISNCMYKYPPNVNKQLESISVLDDNSWPTSYDLNLDQSQYDALKRAITKEFALIQGPPGTGKTYIGLRIVQLLLHNRNRWDLANVSSSFLSDNQKSPILIICYTNHALDQFLEGLTVFTESIIRIGGGSKNEALEKFKLSYKKKMMKEKRLIPKYLYLNIKKKLNELSDIRSSIECANGKLIKLETNILTPDELRHCITEYHFLALSMKYSESTRINTMYKWLGINADEVDASEDHDLVVIADGWQIQGRYMSLKELIKENLYENDMMSEDEAKIITNIWELNSKNRWELYKFWIQSFAEDVKKTKQNLIQDLRKICKELFELRSLEDISIARGAEIIGITTTGAAKYKHIIESLNPTIVVVEEAAEVLESHIVTSLCSHTQHVILIGDHLQLRPSTNIHMLSVKYDLNISLFERLITNGVEFTQLYIQHRMRPEIAGLLVPHIYRHLENHKSVSTYEHILGVKKNVFFISHNHSELHEGETQSKINLHEATFLIALCDYFLKQGYKSSQITILTTYSGQSFELKRLSQDKLKDVRIIVVDSYQGEENDIILLSFVRSNKKGDIGFLKIANRVCVALSRAKKGLFCIGNFNLLAKKSDLWRKIVAYLEDQELIGLSIQLICQNHPYMQSNVKNCKDFDSIPNGGCKLKCEYRLTCGHTCPLMCHPYDREHEKIRCIKPCTKTCKYGHKCELKCYMKCCCTALVFKKLCCGHENITECHEKQEFICDKPCKKILKCGHNCKNYCDQDCTNQCRENIIITSPFCGHKIKVQCFLKDDENFMRRNCQQSCLTLLPCGHICNGLCNACKQGLSHIQCSQNCKKILPSGHDREENFLVKIKDNLCNVM